MTVKYKQIQQTDQQAITLMARTYRLNMEEIIEQTLSKVMVVTLASNKSFPETAKKRQRNA